MLQNNASAELLLSISKTSRFQHRLFLDKIRTVKLIRNLIWVYFLLLFFEGALRKWVFPGLSNSLLVVRDPFAFWMILLALRQGLIRFNLLLAGMLFIGVAGTFTAFYLGHQNAVVALYGARILLLHFPLIFVIGNVLSRDDVIKMGRAVMVIAIPMAILIALQFYSPQSAWVNRGLGGDLKGAGFSGALGFFRPPGTFSFTNGNALFFSFLSVFVLFFWLFPKYINKSLLIFGTLSLLAAIPFSISRSLFFSVCVSCVFALIVTFSKKRIFNYIIAGSVITVILILFKNQLAFLQTPTDAFNARFSGANEAGGGVEAVLFDRYFGGMIRAFREYDSFPFFGYGLGMGTSIGGTLLLGKAGLNIAEDEWIRNIGELGFVMGFAVILIRLVLCIKMIIGSIRKIRQNDLLPWMLLSFVLLNIPQGQWAQPTALGFSVLIGGLLMASLRNQTSTSPIQYHP